MTTLTAGEPASLDVDVVIPVRNGARYVAGCLDSVFAQTAQARAVVVVDDGSTDETAAIVQDYARRHPNIELVRTEARGLPHARNSGVKRCRAPFIAFLDSDDLWEPTKLARQMRVFAAAAPRVGFVHCSYYIIDDAGRRLADRHVIEPRRRDDLFRDLLIERNVVSGSGSAVVVRRELLQRVGGFDEDLTFGEDWDLWLRLAEIADLNFVPEPLVAIRVHDRSMQQTNILDREAASLLHDMRVIDRWYGTPLFPEELRSQYRQRAIRIAIAQKMAPPLSGSNLLERLMSCESRFGRELFAGRADFTVQLLRAGMIECLRPLAKPLREILGPVRYDWLRKLVHR